MMRRMYSDQQLIDYFEGNFPAEKIHEMSLNIGRDRRSLDFLEHLQDEAAWRNDLDPQAISELAGKLLKGFSKLSDPEQPAIRDFPEEFRIGQIFSTRLPLNWQQSHQERRLVLLLSNDQDCFNQANPDVLVAPMSFETNMALPGDMIIPAEKSPTGGALLVRFGDIQNVFVNQLQEYLGPLPPELLAPLKQRWKAAMGLGEIPDEEAAAITSLRDPRRPFSESEHLICAYLRQPVQQMIAISGYSGQEEYIDASYLLDQEIIGREQRRWTGIRRDMLLAADSNQMTLLEGSKAVRYLLLENERWNLYLLMQARTEPLLSIALEPKVYLRSDPFWQNNNLQIEVESDLQIIVSDQFVFDAAQTVVLPCRPAVDFLNKPLIIRIKIDQSVVEKKVHIVHKFIDLKDADES